MTKTLKAALMSAAIPAAVIVSSACAQPLEAIMQDALAGSQTLAADRASLDAQREAVKQARSSTLPSVSVNGAVVGSEAEYDPGNDGSQFLQSLGVSSFGATGLNAPETRNSVGLTARQTLFAGGRVRNSIRAAKASVRAAEAGFFASHEDTVFEIISAYYDVVRVEAQVDALQSSATTLREQEAAATKSFELGRATRTDVASVEAQRANVEAQLITAQAQVRSARLNFTALTGLSHQQFVLTEDLPAYPDDIEELIAIAKRSNGNILAAEALVEAGDAQVRIAKGQHLPAVELAGSMSYSEGNLIEGDNLENASLQLQMSVPLFAGGRIQSEVRQARAELKSTRYAQADLNRRLEAAIRAAYGETIAARVSRHSAELQVSARELAFEGVSIEADLGKRTTLEVLDAEDDLLQARFSAVDAGIREHLTTYNLLRLAGTLSQTFGAKADAQ